MLWVIEVKHNTVKSDGKTLNRQPLADKTESGIYFGVLAGRKRNYDV
jgi:hypothetical protein